ncbi:cutinase [Micromonospora rifamycinica]|uniref:Cutinase n=2 Tax=Micromonospora rifamycinica TaxID=291594 RepID=A0A1C5KD52_9ACTN|nr:cutinase [Micromonospora rifamycinica]
MQPVPALHPHPARSGPRRPWPRLVARPLLALALVGGGALAAPGAPAAAGDGRSAAAVAANPYERGPAPTVSSIEAARGPFAIAQSTVAASAVSGFRGGTVYYPTSTAEGTFGAVAISPGYTASQSSVAWLGPRLASQGFVVITIDTLSVYDQPASRGTQLLAALDYLTGSSAVRTRIDRNRLAVMGHSMGGGGSLSAANTRPTLQAAIPLTGWHTVKNWSSVRVPTLVVGAENDSTAPVSSHSEPFYTSLPASLDKAYLELNAAGHSAPTSANVTVAKYSISWLKRFVDDDTRYEQFLCPAPRGSAIEEYRDTCPHS